MGLLREMVRVANPRVLFEEVLRPAWTEADRESDAARAEADGEFDTGPVWALVTGAVMLTITEYWGDARALTEFLRWLRTKSFASEWDLPSDAVVNAYPDQSLWTDAWWGAWLFFGYFVVPATLLKLRGKRIRDQGLAWNGTHQHAAVYLMGLSVVLVCVAFAAQSEAFFQYYPFYDLAGRSWADFLAWEAIYAAQFFGLEFYFRGHLLAECRDRMGAGAVFVAIVPYVMIHFGKPMSETLGAIIAGTFLGTLALATRSIWGGFFVHVSVALSMDIAALVQRGGLPETFFPPG